MKYYKVNIFTIIILYKEILLHTDFKTTFNILNYQGSPFNYIYLKCNNE